MAKPLVIKGVIDRFENKLAIIKTEKGAEILWPISELPEELIAGSAVLLTLSNEADQTQQGQALAQDMLNEILNVPTNNAN